MQLFWVLIHCKAQSEGALVHRVGGEQGPCSTCKERSPCPEVPFPVHRDGRKQHTDLGKAAQKEGGKTQRGSCCSPRPPICCRSVVVSFPSVAWEK